MEHPAEDRAPDEDRAAAGPLVSIVIPARNEAADIEATLEACLAIDHEPKEIIVADDSTDETPEVVARYADRGVRLLHRERNTNGCCGARNAGMRSARGEILVLMNADDRPRPDFLKRVLAHYDEGADFVVVESQVQNADEPWASFVHASHVTAAYTDPHWSEGFSCRRSAAEAVGFIPGDYPINFCRDALFGEVLGREGFRKRYDPTIPMEHVAPNRFADFWSNRVWRGSFSAPFSHYVRGLPVPTAVARELARMARTTLLDLLVVPLLWRSWRLARNHPPAASRFPQLLAATAACDAATVVGGWRGLRNLLRTEGLRGGRGRVPAPTDPPRIQP